MIIKKQVIFNIFLFMILLFGGICVFLKGIGYRSNSPNEYSQTTINSAYETNEYKNFNSISSKGATIPGLAEGSIPQGICYIENQDVFLTTGYHKGGAPSTVFVIDKDSGELLKSVILYDNEGNPFCGHVGGIASDGTWVWIGSENSIYVFAYDLIKNANDMDSVILSKVIPCSVNADYVYWDGTHLWVGEYNYAPFYRTDTSHIFVDSTGIRYSALVVRYSILPFDGTIGEAEFALYVPDKVQAIVLQDDGSVILSCSFWCFESSKLMCYFLLDDSESSTVRIDDKQIPVFYLAEQYLLWELSMPPMAEGIAFADGNYYILFESDARLYSWYASNRLGNIMIVPSQSIYSKEDS